MSNLRQAITEIHRRSPWQVLGIHVAASWVVIQVVETLGSAPGERPGKLTSLSSTPGAPG